MLIHNAGALSRRYTVTDEGDEVTVVTQLVAPFLLSGLLLDRLRASVPSRVIQVSSGGMYTQKFDLDTLEMGPDGYDGTVAYAKVKRAQLVLMHEWSRRLLGSGVMVHAMHPGWADTPGIRDSLPGFSKVMGPVLRTPEQGADTAVWLAAIAGGWSGQRGVLAGPPPPLGAQGAVDPSGRGRLRSGRLGVVGVVCRPGRVGRAPTGRVDGDGGTVSPSR